MRRLVLLLAILVLVAYVSYAARVIKLAHVTNEKDIFHYACVKFKEFVEDWSNGQIIIEIYPNRQLGDERTILEGLRMGTIDMGFITDGPIALFVPEFSILALPFLFKSPEDAYTKLDGKPGQILLKKMERAGMVGLAFGERGFRNITNSKHPVRRPEDLRGLKIRVMQNPTYVKAFKLLGANVVPMAWSEVLTALQQGTVDGQENPIGVIYAFKLYDLRQKYMTLDRHTYSPAVFIVSKKLWDELTPRERDILRDAARAAAEAERAYNNRMESVWLKFLKEKAGMIIEEHPDIEAFRRAVKPLYDEYRKRFGKLVDMFLGE